MQNPMTCGQAGSKSNKSRSGWTFCTLRKESNGLFGPCAVEQGRGDDCPLEHTMQSGDSAVIQQGDAGER